MTDLLGPAGSTPNVTTERPTDYRIFGADDTWIKDCTDPVAKDGTPLIAPFFNGVLAQIRRAIRGMGVAQDNADDDMLLKAIQRASTGRVSEADALLAQQAFPHMLTPGNVFTITASVGQIIIADNQSWAWRGVKLFNTSQVALSDRTFPLLPNKTYHLWAYPPGFGDATPSANYPYGRYACKDVQNVVYNPTALPEENEAFDGTRDAMLIARIVTNGANVPSITYLPNRAVLYASVDLATVPVSIGNNAYQASYSVTLNWPRKPQMKSGYGYVYTTSPLTAVVSGGANRVTSETLTRYGFATSVFTDWDSTPGGFGAGLVSEYRGAFYA
ncbi:hypothetical protein [Microvirga solisilvae]|uniref:hypothetical protein n=1 Tax=Microvirga solisilvae TaxID=2919498 RepID=UPI001FAF5F68|nr:hypothetical protein [Microvirga solisilvae]